VEVGAGVARAAALPRTKEATPVGEMTQRPPYHAWGLVRSQSLET
jgi:hypothetical protein